MRYKVSTILAFLLLTALAFSYIGRKEITVSDEEHENRRMHTFAMVFNPETDPQSEVFGADKSYSDRFEDAMKDQIFIRDSVVHWYSDINTFFANIYNNFWLKMNSNHFNSNNAENRTDEILSNSDMQADFDMYPVYGYPRLPSFTIQNYYLTQIGNWYRINNTEYIGKAPTTAIDQETKDIVVESVAQLQAIMDAYHEIKVYNYLVSQSDHTPWFDSYLGTKTVDLYEYIAQQLPLSIKVDRLMFEDFEDYKQVYYRSDHHWSHRGSKRGYEDVYAMMAEDLNLSPMLQPVKEWDFTSLYGVQYRGSRASKLQDAYEGWDKFMTYEYAQGNRKTYVSPIDDIYSKTEVTFSLHEKYVTGEINKSVYYDHYVNYYGQSYDKDGNVYSDSSYVYVIDNGSDSQHNLLMVGDSTQRVYRDVIASHFGTTVYLDYRIMNQVNVDELIELYDIDVLLVGGRASGYWTSNTANFSFSEEFEMKQKGDN